VVETIRLESGHTLTGIVGSNPTLSARFYRAGGRPSISLAVPTKWVPRSSRTLRRAGTTNACTRASITRQELESKWFPAFIDPHRARFHPYSRNVGGDPTFDLVGVSNESGCSARLKPCGHGFALTFFPCNGNQKQAPGSE
jgi:hypothetical protein